MSSMRLLVQDPMKTFKGHDIDPYMYMSNPFNKRYLELACNMYNHDILCASH